MTARLRLLSLLRRRPVSIDDAMSLGIKRDAFHEYVHRLEADGHEIEHVGKPGAKTTYVLHDEDVCTWPGCRTRLRRDNHSGRCGAHAELPELEDVCGQLTIASVGVL